MKTESIRAALAASAGLHLAVAVAVSTLPSWPLVPPGGEVAIPVELVLTAPAAGSAAGGAEPRPPPDAAAAGDAELAAEAVPLDEVRASSERREAPALRAPLPPAKPERTSRARREPAEPAESARPSTVPVELPAEQPPQAAESAPAEAAEPPPTAASVPPQQTAWPSRSAGDGTRTETGDSGGAGTAASSSTAASVGSGGDAAEAQARSNYVALLQTWLEKHKRYPRVSQVRGEEGTALLRFTVDRSGRVLSHRLDRSAGHAALDREVVAMIERAQPLPPIPDDVADQALDLALPVSFVLR